MSALPASSSDFATSGWLAALPHWPLGVAEALKTEPVVVRVLVASVRGSAPREPGACLLVSGDRVSGTIGGGHLEWEAIQAARGLGGGGGPAARLWKRVLGTELGQCCGGVVELWLERWTRSDVGLLETLLAAREARSPRALSSELNLGDGRLTRRVDATPERAGPVLERTADRLRLIEPLSPWQPPVWLFGAGHVGQALARQLTELPFALTWVDGRPGIFPAPLPGGIRARAGAPLVALHSAPANARYVVMTHDHGLDYALVRAVLIRGDAGFLGLIGSSSKAARFRSRLARDGLRAEQIATLVCPIGIEPGLGGAASKLPAVIAVGVAAQLLQTLSISPAAAPAAVPPELTDCTTNPCPSCPSRQP